MAGNNSIQMLRGTTSTISASSAELLPGQPLYNIETKEFFVGGGGNSVIKNAVGVTANKVKNPLTLSVNGATASYDGSEAKTV